MTGARRQQKESRAMDDRFRTSDADRDRAAAQLRDHFGAGRLSHQELDERLTATLTARNFGDLRGALADLPDPAQVLQQATGLPPQAGPLERSYRRLLAFYPARYRRVHEEEMLAVLMTGAPDGKRRPGTAEAADLIWGALRVRLQPSRIDAEPSWRDALAVVSVILPVVFLMIYTVRFCLIALSPMAPSLPGDALTQLWFHTLPIPLAVAVRLAVPFAMAALVLLRRPRAAALVAAALLIWLLLLSQPGGVGLTVSAPAYLCLALGLEIAALAASPGPRRGLQILTRKHAMLMVIAALAAGTIDRIAAAPAVQITVVAVICAGMMLSSSLGRWLLVLLAVPAYPFAVEALHNVPVLSTALIYLPPLAGLTLAVMAARRGSLRSLVLVLSGYPTRAEINASGLEPGSQ
jgi:hypothetical protein